jgi:hypothetical protein
VITTDVVSDNEAAPANCIPSALAHLLSVSPTLVLKVFAARLAANVDTGYFGVSIGATDAWTNNASFPEIEEGLSNI